MFVYTTNYFMTLAAKPKKARKPRVKKAKAADVVASLSDDYGNLLITKNNGKRVLLSLKLVSERNKFRRIGTINLEQRVLDIRRKRGRHLFNMNESYGFNYKLLSEAKLFDTVRLSDEHQIWKFPKQFVIDNGSFLHFKKEGFERQIFVTLQQLAPYTRPARI